MIIEELNHCGGNIPMAPNLLIMFDMVEFGTPEQIQYAVDYYKENGYPPTAWPSPSRGRSANQYMTTTATKKDGKIHINGTKTWVPPVRTPTASSWSARTRIPLPRTSRCPCTTCRPTPRA